jgi:DNA-binding CsgD family transcriptional regulator
MTVRVDPAFNMHDEALIDRIYRTSFEPDTWRSILGDMCARIGAGSAMFTVATDAFFGHVTVGSAEKLLPDFLQKAPLIGDPRAKRAYDQLARFIDDREVLSPHELATLPYCRDFIYNLERAHQAASFFVAERGLPISVHFSRPPGEQPFGAEQFKWLETMRPHAMRGIELMVNAEWSRMTSVVKTLGHLKIPAAVISIGGKSLIENEAFAMSREEVFGRTSHQVGLGLSPAAARVRTELKLFERGWAACFSRRPVTSFPVAGVRPSERHVVHLTLCGEGPATLSIGLLMLITRVGIGETLPVEMIEFLFDLTSMQAVIAQDIGAGKSVGEIASERGLSEHTVRSHLKTIYDKLDVHRQAELIRLVQQPYPTLRSGG